MLGNFLDKKKNIMELLYFQASANVGFAHLIIVTLYKNLVGGRVGLEIFSFLPDSRAPALTMYTNQLIGLGIKRM